MNRTAHAIQSGKNGIGSALWWMSHRTNTSGLTVHRRFVRAKKRDESSWRLTISSVPRSPPKAHRLAHQTSSPAPRAGRFACVVPTVSSPLAPLDRKSVTHPRAHPTRLYLSRETCETSFPFAGAIMHPTWMSDTERGSAHAQSAPREIPRPTARPSRSPSSSSSRDGILKSLFTLSPRTTPRACETPPRSGRCRSRAGRRRRTTRGTTSGRRTGGRPWTSSTARGRVERGRLRARRRPAVVRGERREALESVLRPRGGVPHCQGGREGHVWQLPPPPRRPRDQPRRPRPGRRSRGRATGRTFTGARSGDD